MSRGPGRSEGGFPALTFNGWLRWDILRRLIDEKEGLTSFLEIGCGKGAIGARLAARFEYLAYEPDLISAEEARGAIEPAGRIIPERLPAQPDHTFDAAVALEVLEHMERDVETLRTWRGWLEPGGWLFLSVPAGSHRFGPWDEAVGHYRRYDREGLRKALATAGFRGAKVVYYGFPLGYALEWARNRLVPSLTAPPEDRTKASGRLMQPPDALGWLTRLFTLPFRVMQRPFQRRGPGTGLVAVARNQS